MPGSRREDLIDAGVRVADEPVHDQDRTWSRFGSDKPDVGRAFAEAARPVLAAVPSRTALRCLSIGSSAEPQLRLMHALAAGGTTLLDIAPEGLAAVEERVARQFIEGVTTVRADYTRAFASPAAARAFRRAHLGGRRAHLVALHHSLYYCPSSAWPSILHALHEEVLERPGALHAVLMSATADRADSTTALYARFAGRFHGHVNDQSLPVLARRLRRDAAFAGSEIRCRASEVRFRTDDFARLMAVVWMILLYPQVHDYDATQKREIAAYVHDTFFAPRRPLVQVQDHLTIVRT